jgi:hypothetical protein
LWILKALENQSGSISILNPSATLSLSGCQTFRDVLKQGILSPKDIEVTFDNFPYYLRYSLVFHGFALTATQYQ